MFIAGSVVNFCLLTYLVSSFLLSDLKYPSIFIRRRGETKALDVFVSYTVSKRADFFSGPSRSDYLNNYVNMKRNVTKNKFSNPSSKKVAKNYHKTDMSEFNSSIISFLELNFDLQYCGSHEEIRYSDPYIANSDRPITSSDDILSISRLLDEQCLDLDAHSFCRVSNYLGKLRLSTTSLPVIRAPLLKYLNQIASADSGRKRGLQYISVADLSLLLQGLARLKVDFAATTEGQTGSPAPPLLLLALERCLQAEETIDRTVLVDLVWGLCTTRLNWTALPPLLQRSLLRQLAASMQGGGSLSAYRLSSLLWSLAKMGLRWVDLPSSLTGSLVQILRSPGPQSSSSSAATCSPHQASKLLWAMGCLNVPKSALPYQLLESWLQLSLDRNGLVNIANVTTGALSVPEGQALTGLIRCGVEWTALSSPSQQILERLLYRLCNVDEGDNFAGDRSLSCAAWVGGSLSFSVHSQSAPLRELLLESSLRLVQRHGGSSGSRVKDGSAALSSAWMLCNVVWGLAKMSYRWDDFPPALQEALKVGVLNLRAVFKPSDVGSVLILEAS